MTVIIPIFGFHDIHDTEIGIFANDKSGKINKVAAFAGVNPSTLTIDNKAKQYEKALVKADNGTVADTALKDQWREELELLLSQQAYDCAKIANGNLALYLSSGYEAKNTKGNPVGPLPAVTGLNLFYGDSPGELKAFWDSMPKAKNFSVQVYSDFDDPYGSIIKEFIKGKLGKKKTLLDGLPSGQIVFVRVRANGGSTNYGPWSNMAEKRVP